MLASGAALFDPMDYEALLEEHFREVYSSHHSRVDDLRKRAHNVYVAWYESDKKHE